MGPSILKPPGLSKNRVRITQPQHELTLIHESPAGENVVVVVDPNSLVLQSVKDPLDEKRVEGMVTT